MKKKISMKHPIYGLIVMTIAMVLSACADGTDVKHIPGRITPPGNQTEPVSESSFSYEFKVNECNTGKQELASKEELCIALQNETLNKGCAVELREIHFQSRCEGQVFEPFTEDSTDKEQIEDSGKPTFEDKLEDEQFSRVMKYGQGTLVLHKNPEGDSLKTVVYCVEQKEDLEQTDFDGKIDEENAEIAVLTLGGVAVFLNDTSVTYKDGSQLPGKIINIICGN